MCFGMYFFFFPKYFSLFFRLIYLKDHQGSKPHVRFMLYHLFFNHKQDFKQNRVIYIVLSHVNRCSRRGLDPKSLTDLPPANACTNYSFRHRGMIKFFHQENSLGLVSSAPPRHGADQRQVVKSDAFPDFSRWGMAGGCSPHVLEIREHPCACPQAPAPSWQQEGLQEPTHRSSSCTEIASSSPCLFVLAEMAFQGILYK